MAEELLRARVRDPRRRPRPRLPAPRERARAVARARTSVRADLGAQRHAPVHRREDVEVGRQHHDDPRGARRVGARDAARLLPDRRTGASRSTSPRRRWRRPPAQAESFRERLSRVEPSPAGDWERFAAALDDDFNTPEALAVHARLARPRALLRRALGVFGLESLAERDEAPPEIVELAERRSQRATSATSTRPTGSAPRSRRPAGRCATRPAGFALVRKR